MPDLLTVLHSIDRLRGKTCGACASYVPIDPTGRAINDPRMCLKGYGPADADDGCDDFSPAPLTRAEVGARAKRVLFREGRACPPKAKPLPVQTGIPRR
jgi:hypothetical protein